jgi:hypothetical protein
MNFKVKLPGGETAELTTEHSASSYGQPVLLLNGDPCGTDDLIGDLERPEGVQAAGHLVQQWARRLCRTPAERDAARTFLLNSQWQL